MLRLVVAGALGLIAVGCSIDRLGKARPDGSTGEIDADLPDVGAFDVGPCTGGCDDGIDCTVDACVTDSCRHTPSDALCSAAPGGRCDGVSGCQYPKCNADVCAGGPCEVATCEGSMCVRRPLCAGDEMCCAGACVPAGCADGNRCTSDRCDETGCVHEANTNSCDDGDPCTTGDQCSGGACVGMMPDCDDGNECTNDFCDPSRGGCDNARARDGTTCRDGLYCTIGDACQDGVCTGGGARDCPTPCSCDEGGDRCEHPSGGGC